MSVFHAVSIVWAVISFTLLIFSWRFAATGKILLHRNLMLFLLAGAWAFIFNYLFQGPYTTDTAVFPRELILWVAFHGTMGMVLLVGASCLVVSRFWRKNDLQKSHLNRQHKLYGRCLVVLWLFSHLGGIFNAFLF